MPRLTIGKLAQRCGISRAAVLHYETLGLLKPAARSAAGYRYYDEAEIDRLRQIRTYRDAGLSMEAIRRLLSDGGGASVRLLQQRLADIDRNMACLREQQRMIVRMLGLDNPLGDSGGMTKERWVGLLAAAGFDAAGMKRWHALFERDAPDLHQDFLLSLAIPSGEITEIREMARRHAVESVEDGRPE